MRIKSWTDEVLPLWISAVIITARRTDSGWISGNQTVTQYDNNVVLACYSDHRLPAEWRFQPKNESTVFQIYASRKIQPRFEGKFDIAANESNFYNLSIINVSLDMEGIYECVEGSGVPGTASHRLYLHVNDFDECVTKNHSCSPFANCSNTVGSFDCNCYDGYSGDGHGDDGCKDVNECLVEENGGCWEHSKCFNTEGSFSCPCDEGFQRAGSHCIDIDECLESACDENANCSNTVGSFTCGCNVGFAGLGLNNTCHELKQLRRHYLHKLVDDVGLLTCETNYDAFVIWLFINPTELSQAFLYQNGHIIQNAGRKVTADNKKRQCGKCGNYDIKLHDIQLNFTGWYLCIENEGWGKAHGIFLNVTGLDGLVYMKVFANVGSSESLSCQTSFTATVVWFYAKNLQSSRKYLFVNGSVNADAQREFGHDVIPTYGQYDVNLHNIQPNNSGYYMCIDDNGMGKILRGYELKVKDVDKCFKEEIHGCGAHSKCVNGREGFVCKCDDGYFRNSSICIDVDECSLKKNGGCVENSKCTNTEGSYSCTCDEGFQHSGSECVERDWISPERDWISPGRMGIVIGIVAFTIFVVSNAAVILFFWIRRLKERQKRYLERVKREQEWKQLKEELEEQAELLEQRKKQLKEERRQKAQEKQRILEAWMHRRRKELSAFPTELMKIVLMKAVVLLYKLEMKSITIDADRRAVKTISKVCSLNQRLIHRAGVERIVKRTFDHNCRRHVGDCKRLAVTSADGSESRVCGVATFDNQLLVISHNSSEVCIFDLTSFIALPNIELEGLLEDPSDIATCEATRRIYIADGGDGNTRCVLRIDGDTWRAEKFITYEDQSLTACWPLSLSTDGRRRQLLVTKDNEIHVYVGDNLLLFLSVGVQILNAVPSVAGHSYFVCHRARERSFNEVSEYHYSTHDSTFRRLRHYPIGPCDDGPQRLVLMDDSRLLVADGVARRVIVLNSKLEQPRVLLKKQQLSEDDNDNSSGPSCLCYNARNGLLCVGMDGKEPHVNVYKIRGDVDVEFR